MDAILLSAVLTFNLIGPHIYHINQYTSPGGFTFPYLSQVDSESIKKLSEITHFIQPIWLTNLLLDVQVIH